MKIKSSVHSHVCSVRPWFALSESFFSPSWWFFFFSFSSSSQTSSSFGSFRLTFELLAVVFFLHGFSIPNCLAPAKQTGGTWSLVFKPLEKCIIQTPAHTCPHTDGRRRINWLFCVALVNIYTNRNMYEQPRSITQKSGSRAGVMSRYKAECNRHARTDRLHIICLHARPFTAARIPLTHPVTSFLGGLLLPQEEAKQPGMSECK